MLIEKSSINYVFLGVIKNHFPHLFDLTEKCRNPQFDPYSSFVPGFDKEKRIEILNNFGLVDPQGNPYKDTLNVVLSGVTGNGFELQLIDPIDHSDNVKEDDDDDNKYPFVW